MTVLEFPNPSRAKGIPRIRVERGDLFADIVLDQQSGPDVYWVIVQRHGSSAVLSLERHLSYEDATSSAEHWLGVLAAIAA